MTGTPPSSPNNPTSNINQQMQMITYFVSQCIQMGLLSLSSPNNLPVMSINKFVNELI